MTSTEREQYWRDLLDSPAAIVECNEAIRDLLGWPSPATPGSPHIRWGRDLRKRIPDPRRVGFRAGPLLRHREDLQHGLRGLSRPVQAPQTRPRMHDIHLGLDQINGS